MKINILLSIVVCAINIQIAKSNVSNVYCGDENCYDILGISSTATSDQIRQAFRKQSKEFHPDKNLHKGIDTHVKYQQYIQNNNVQTYCRQITKAYEVLKDSNIRDSYDSYLQNPSKGEYYHYYNYYKAVYAPQTNPFVVILSTLLFLSFFQYLARKNAYTTAINNVQRTDKFKVDVNNLHREQPHRQKSEIREELLQRIVIQGGQSKLKVNEVLIIKICLIPITFLLFLYKKIRWVVRYNIQKKEYTREDQELLTKKLLNIKDMHWDGIEHDEKEELMSKELWKPDNYKEYKREQTEMNEKRKEEFFSTNRGKKYLRYMKNSK